MQLRAPGLRLAGQAPEGPGRAARCHHRHRSRSSMWWHAGPTRTSPSAPAPRAASSCSTSTPPRRRRQPRPPRSTSTARCRQGAPSPPAGEGRTSTSAIPGHKVSNDAGRRLGDGLDIRGDGGYVLAPPSRHASGGRYAVAGSRRRDPAMPDWLVERLQAPACTPRPPVDRFHRGDDTTAWAKAALEGELSGSNRRSPATGTTPSTASPSASARSSPAASSTKPRSSSC